LTTEITLDCRGLRCPLPVLKLEKAVEGLDAGDTLTVIATDPVARVDIPLFCRQHGHLCEVEAGEGALTFRITVA
jgi:tRNA 2-thiouridine synthesizing protein A